MGRTAAALLIGVVGACAGSSSESSPTDSAEAFERALAAACELQGGGLTQRRASALEAGTATFRKPEAARCLSFLEEHPCRHGSGDGLLAGLALRLPGVWRAAYAGTLAPGEDCGDDVECAGDSFCGTENDAMTTTCKARRPAGTLCSDIGNCSVSEEQVPDCVPDSDGARRCVAEE